MWNDEDKFFYDTMSVAGAEALHLRIFSIVGLTSLFAVSTIEKRVLDKLEDFRKRIAWFENYRNKNKRHWPNEERSDGKTILLSLVKRDRLVFLLERLLDETQFLSPWGIRALSKYHEQNPYTVAVGGVEYTIRYDPGDSTSELLGVNSNRSGPVWMPINFLIIQSIRHYGEFYGDELQVECPVGSGNKMNLVQVADELTYRLIKIFEQDKSGKRAFHGKYNWFYQRPGNEELLLFFEYFHGDDGSGLGASHQTGWTSLLAEMVHTLHGKKPAAGVAVEAENVSG
jgi:hypothetical protein